MLSKSLQNRYVPATAIIILLWGMVHPVYVRAASPPPQILTIDAFGESIGIGTNFQYLRTLETSLSLTDVDKPDMPWQRWDQATLHLMASDETVWVRFCIQNESYHPLKLVLNIDWPFWDTAQLYVQEWLPKCRRGPPVTPLIHMNDKLPFAFQFLCPGNQGVTVHLRMHGTGVMLLPIKIWQQQAYDRMCLGRNLFLGIFFGFLGAMCLYNLSLSFFTQDTSYTYYVVYVISVLLYCLSMTGVGTTYLWRDNTWLNQHAYGLFSSFSFLMATLFIRRFLKLSETGGWIYVMSNILAVFWILMTIFFTVYRGPWMLYWENTGAVASCVAGLLTTIILWHKGSISAKYMTIAWTLLILATFILMLGLTGVIAYQPVIQHSQNIGFMLELLLLSLALADRIKRERVEKEDAQELSIKFHSQAVEAKEREMKAQAKILTMERAAKNELESQVAQRTQQLQNTLEQLESANRQLSQMSRTDGLTQLFNRRYFDEMFEKEFKRATRHERPLSVIMGDIDHFKHINDTYGHQAGDKCLIKVASIWKAHLNRAADLVARYGGEEFISLLPATTIADAKTIAERIRAAIEAATIKFNETHINLTISLGISTLILHGPDNMTTLLKRADNALYEAKALGRNRIEIKV